MVAVLHTSPVFANNVERAKQRTDWNKSPAPDAPYGGCNPAGSGFADKRGVLPSTVQTWGVLAITVLDCRGFDGGGGTNEVACPSGSPYAVCVANHNDGIGNAFLFGVLKRSTTTYANSPTCPGGPNKLDLLIRAGEDPRLVNGIVTLNCGSASGTEAVTRVACPAGPSPYAYCLSTQNDGGGHSVTLGIVAANGPGDPYGLYGECDPVFYSIQNGFRPKIMLVRDAGGEVRKVQAIEILVCNEPFGIGAGFPLRRMSCDSPSQAARYDYCIKGEDPNGNGVAAGVITTK